MKNAMLEWVVEHKFNIMVVAMFLVALDNALGAGWLAFLGGAKWWLMLVGWIIAFVKEMTGK